MASLEGSHLGRNARRDVLPVDDNLKNAIRTALRLSGTKDDRGQ